MKIYAIIVLSLHAGNCFYCIGKGDHEKLGHTIGRIILLMPLAGAVLGWW